MRVGTFHASGTGGGFTGRVSLKDEDYLIVKRDEERPQGFRSIDISFSSHTIRIYDDRPWKIHHMDKDSQTIEFPVLEQS